MVAYFSGCGCRRRVREHCGGAVGFSAAEPGANAAGRGGTTGGITYYNRANGSAAGTATKMGK